MRAARNGGTWLLIQPSQAIFDALESPRLALPDLDVFELNGAFASVVVASTRHLSIPDDVVNVNGGAIARSCCAA
jgi:acetyl-CoA C-acetyltransferase